jgi:cysteine desulfurase/selenocysteine lyase
MNHIDLLEQLHTDFIGLDTQYRLADGRIACRHYLDSAASTLALRPARQLADELLRHYANTHSQAHFSARIANRAYAWAHRQVLDFVQADPQRYAAFFAGSGCTATAQPAGANAGGATAGADVVLVSLLEHHANDLPHRKHAGTVIHLPLTGVAPHLGAVDLAALERLLEQHRGRVNYVAIPPPATSPAFATRFTTSPRWLMPMTPGSWSTLRKRSLMRR